MNIKDAYEKLDSLLTDQEFKIGVEVWKFEHSRMDIEWSIYLPDTNERFTNVTLEDLMKEVVSRLQPERGEIDEVMESIKGVI